MLYGYLYFRISAYAALKMNVGILWYNESYVYENVYENEIPPAALKGT